MTSTGPRLQRLREKMEGLKLDAFFVGAPVEDIFHNHGANRRYLSGFTGSMGWLLISRDQAFIAVDFRYVEQAERECPGYTVFPTIGAAGAWFTQLVGEAGVAGKRIGFEPGDLAVSTFQALKKGIEALAASERPKLLASPSVVSELRAIKDAEEIAKLQRAVDIGDAAFEHVAERIEPGWTELQIAWEIEKHARENGAEHMSFPTIVAAGPHGAMPHAMPRDVAVKAGDCIVIDMGVIYEGYCSDLTRTVVVGKPGLKFIEIYDIVLTAQRTAEELITSGITGEEAHNYAHAVITEAGYGENFGHGLGHGVGLLIHEAPRVARASNDELLDGMILTVEPGIYLTGWGGIRIEDQCVLENGKLRVMSNAPKLFN